MTIADDINRVFRDFERYTGDGKPGAPAGAPLPTGDPTSGVHNLSKGEIRSIMLAILQSMGNESALTDILDQLDAVTTNVGNGRAYIQYTADPSGRNIATDAKGVLCFTAGGVVSMWTPTSEPAGGVETDDIKKDASGRWWLCIFRKSDLIGLIDDLALAVRDGATIPTTNIGGTGDAITADIMPSFVEAGITTLSSIAEVEIVPVATNTAPNPTFTIAGATYGIRTADNGAWPANGFVVGRPYKLRRRNTTMRVVQGEVTGVELGAEAKARADADAKAAASLQATSREGGTIPLVNVAGTGDAATAAIAQSFLDAGITVIAELSLLRFRPVATNTTPTPKMTVGGTQFTFVNADGAALPVSFFKIGRPYVLIRVGTTLRVIGGDVTQTELEAARQARIVADALMGTATLDTISGTGDVMTAALPTLLTDSGISAANLRRITFTAVGTNTGVAAPTMNIADQGPVGIYTSDNTIPAAGHIVPGRTLEAVKKSGRWLLVSDASRVDVVAATGRITAIEDKIPSSYTLSNDPLGVSARMEADSLFYVAVAYDQLGDPLLPVAMPNPNRPYFYNAYGTFPEGSDLLIADSLYYLAEAGGSGSGTGFGVNDKWLHPDGTLQAPYPDESIVSLWGDSSSQIMGPAFERGIIGIGKIPYAMGKGSEGWQQIFARLGSDPYIIQFPNNVIPAGTDPVNVTTPSPTLGIHSALRPYDATIAGVLGRIAWLTGSTYRFTRAVAGEAVQLQGNEVAIPTIGMLCRKSPIVLWAGKNSLTANDPGVAVADATHRAVQFLSPMIKKVLVLGFFGNGGSDLTTPWKIEMAKANRIMAERYGDQFIDILAWMKDDATWEKLGLTKTAEDIADLAVDNMPPSLRDDVAHATKETYAGVVNQLIVPRLQQLWKLGG